MAQTQPTQQKAPGRPPYIYALPEEILDSVKYRESDGAPQVVEKIQKAETTEIQSLGPQACSNCQMSFTCTQEFKSHVRSDMHQYNLRLRLRGQSPVTEAEFESLVEHIEESLSGSNDSDSDGEDGPQNDDDILPKILKHQLAKTKPKDTANEQDGSKMPQRSALIWMDAPQLPENTCYGVYRALLSAKEAAQGDAEIVEILRKKQLEPVTMPKVSKDGTPLGGHSHGPHIFMAMIGGGHFAAMVVSLSPRKGAHKEPLNKQATVLAHKTFHRYTTRRKQGGAQSANDNSKGTAHSAGSGLRRYNEKALTEDIRTLLKEWKALIDSSELVFVRANGAENRRTLFGPYDGQVLRSDDARLRSFPFTTARATQNELMRCFIQLTCLKTSELKPNVAPKTEPDSRKAKETSLTPPPTTEKRELSEQELTTQLHTSQIQAFIRRSKVPALISYIKNNSLSPDFALQPAEKHFHAPTALHLAASANSPTLVQGLLLRAGADPTIKNGLGRTPFELAGDGPTRDAFRAARGELGDDRWDWAEAKVPSALSGEEMHQRAQKRETEREQEKQIEEERREAAEANLRAEEKAAAAAAVAKKPARAQKSLIQSYMEKRTAQEVREEEQRGMTAEMRVRLERERRARAAEARMKKMG